MESWWILKAWNGLAYALKKYYKILKKREGVSQVMSESKNSHQCITQCRS